MVFDKINQPKQLKPINHKGEMMQKWVLASNNQGKLAEFQALFDDACQADAKCFCCLILLLPKSFLKQTAFFKMPSGVPLLFYNQSWYHSRYILIK